MARKTRLELPDSLYYVIIRGNQNQRIFHDNEDGTTFLKRLGNYKERFPFTLYAYVMMPTHIHLLLEDPQAPLFKIMQGLQQSYTQYYNRKYGVHGHVFQGRYQAYIVEKETYLCELIRFVHVHPVRSKIVIEPESYIWSGHYELSEKRPEQLIDWKKLLLLFAPTVREGLQVYRTFIMDGIGKEIKFPIEGRQVIGRKEFAEDIFHKAGIQKSSLSNKPSISLNQLANIIAEFYTISPEEIMGDSKYHSISAARRALMFIAVERLKIPNSQVSEFLDRSPATVSLQIRRVKTLLKKDASIQEQFRILEKKINEECTKIFNQNSYYCTGGIL